MVLTSVLDSSVPSDIRSSLLDHFMQETAVDLLHTLGVIDYLNDTSNNLTRGALDALPLLLLHATPSINLLAALKQPFNNEILSRTPPSLGKALHSIHDYLMVCAPTSTVHVDATHPCQSASRFRIQKGRIHCPAWAERNWRGWATGFWGIFTSKRKSAPSVHHGTLIKCNSFGHFGRQAM